ncbi:MAG: carboxylesterase family protein [Betaproteobacteria bacterium]|nr:carboxylesterase family protein [Betaproteobacteria bacterium]
MKNKMLSHVLAGAALVGLLFFVPMSKVLAQEKPRTICMGGMGLSLPLKSVSHS